MFGKVLVRQKVTILGGEYQKKIILIDNTEICLQIWDTFGQEKFHSLGYAFYRGADCCVLCYDITSTQSFEALDKWHKNVLEYEGAQDSQSTFVCLGNKVDQEADRLVSTARG